MPIGAPANKSVNKDPPRAHIIKFLNYKNDFINQNFENDSIKKIHRIIKNFDVSEKIVLDLFDGIESDLKEKIELKSKRELLVYSYRVAGTVGLMMAKILRVKSKTALKSAIDLGIAMQLTNISRDVIEDREKNREYIKHDISNIKKALDDGWVITFPQGTTTPFKPIRKGTAHIIKHYKPVVVPIVIDGFRRAFDKKGIRIKKKNILQSMEISMLELFFLF